MIYDPTDLNLAMDETGCVLYRRATDGEQPEWVPLAIATRREFPTDPRGVTW